MKVQIFLNEGRGHFFGFKKFADVPELHKVFEFEFEMPKSSFPATGNPVQDILHMCYTEFNVGGLLGKEQEYRARGNRSLSIGDVVIVGETAWACEDVGWKLVTTDELLEFIVQEKH